MGRGPFAYLLCGERKSALEILKKVSFMLRNPEDIPVVSLFPKECLVPSLLPTHTLHGKTEREREKRKKQLIPLEGSKVVKFLR